MNAEHKVQYSVAARTLYICDTDGCLCLRKNQDSIQSLDSGH